MSKIKALIFDMDGTLVDSESFVKEPWQEAARQLGYVMTEELFHSMVGTNAVDCRRILESAFGDSFEFDRLKSIKLNLEMKKYGTGKLQLKKGALELLRQVKSIGEWPIALATSTERSRVEIRLNDVALKDYFSVIVCGDEVGIGKPDPEIYIKAAHKLGVGIESCLVIEDSSSGVLAGLNSGAKVIWVKDLVDISPGIRQRVWKSCSNLYEVMEILIPNKLSET